MAKYPAQTPLVLPAREPGQGAGRWLYSALRAAILDGRLRSGSRLPTAREQARHYGLARGTIVSTFEPLRSEGYVDAAVGSGTFVAHVLPDRLLEAARPRFASGGAARSPARQLSVFGRRVEALDNRAGGPVRA